MKQENVCIFSFKVNIEDIPGPGKPKKIINAWVNLVDLAGSEKVKKTGGWLRAQKRWNII